ncbi:glycerate kinase [Candidatus Bathyarchaeota archaeon]|nr:glycerate kinase [Candidatus Bathyarchaeota archaeon]
MKIKNSEHLKSNTCIPELRRLRADAVKILEAALDAVDPRRAVLEKVQTSDLGLKIEDLNLPWDEIGDIVVVGGGKAAGPMAEAIEETLGDRVKDGLLNVLKGTECNYSLTRIKLNPASHPIPDQSGVRGVRAMMRMVSGLDRRDLVICLISGGGSALMPLPAEDVTLEDIQNVTGILLKAGATINELNAVRKHLSAFKGGQLARASQPAKVVSLILSDVVGSPLDVIASGPTSPDPTTFEDAINVLKKYGVWEDVSRSVRKKLEEGEMGEMPDTPKTDDPLFQNVHNVVVASNVTASVRAKEEAERLGYNAQLLTTRLEGEARHAGVFIAGLSKGIIFDGVPLKPPAALVIGGETTVKVRGRGVGGRNQELALGAAQTISGLDCVVAALGTDGIDGPTDAAGAIVDGETARRARELGLNLGLHLEANDSYNFFKAMEDHILTGPTGTNVNDLTIVLCGNKEDV